MTRYSPRTGLPQEYQTGPFDSTHLYLQWGGKLPGNESWSCGLRFAGPDASAVADAAAMLPACVTAVTAFHTSVNMQISERAKLSQVKLNAINADGHYVTQATNSTVVADTAGGGEQWPEHPNQVALAVSFTTGFSRGPAHRGRIYVPLPTQQIEDTGLIQGVAAIAVRTQTTALIAALNAVNANWKLAVFSRKAGAPSHRLITGCQIGKAMDTMRRRRRSLVENYV